LQFPFENDLWLIVNEYKKQPLAAPRAEGVVQNLISHFWRTAGKNKPVSFI